MFAYHKSFSQSSMDKANTDSQGVYNVLECNLSVIHDHAINSFNLMVAYFEIDSSLLICQISH